MNQATCVSPASDATSPPPTDTPSIMPPGVAPHLRDRLSTRIVASSLAALVVVLSMVGWTLWLSWQLEGAGAAINDTGSLRMRANRIGIELLQADSASLARLEQEIAAQQDTLHRLESGVPARPLFLPSDHAIRQQFAKVKSYWEDTLQPLARSPAPPSHNYLTALPDFVAASDQLVRMVEQDNAGKTSFLRLSQAVLLLIACLGTLTMIYLLYLWIIAPVARLQHGLQRMAAHEFGARLPVETRDEFGVLARGFNSMADELEALYRELEDRVNRKTRQLAAQNRELEALYEMAAFLNQPNDTEALCRGFLQRLRRQFAADGGSIRILNPDGDKLHLVVAEGLSEALEDSEHCMKIDACFCGKATQQGIVMIRDFRKIPQAENFHCSKDGFTGLAVFQIVAQQEVLGSFSLHFAGKHELTAAETQLLETLGQHLGVALDNRRLGAKARQLAVAQERSLLAQGLHDSIAQGLNFLNLQVQMLSQAADKSSWEDIREIVPMLRTGVDESYQDVRELLLNFRSKLEQGELLAGIHDTVARFRRQTGIAIALEIDESEGAPLPPEDQLQVLFILQEALSNVRKHAEASLVTIRLENHRDFHLQIRDNGMGYDAAQVAERGEAHIGLHIMHERANRIGAQLTMHSAPAQGVCVEIHLARQARQIA